MTENITGKPLMNPQERTALEEACSQLFNAVCLIEGGGDKVAFHFSMETEEDGSPLAVVCIESKDGPRYANKTATVLNEKFNLVFSQRFSSNTALKDVQEKTFRYLSANASLINEVHTVHEDFVANYLFAKDQTAGADVVLLQALLDNLPDRTGGLKQGLRLIGEKGNALKQLLLALGGETERLIVASAKRSVRREYVSGLFEQIGLGITEVTNNGGALSACVNLLQPQNVEPKVTELWADDSRERRMEERSLDQQIADAFFECVAVHVNIAPLCFPEGGKTADLVKTHSASCNARTFLVDARECTNRSEEGRRKICKMFEGLWDSLTRCGLTENVAFMENLDSQERFSCVDEGRFDNELYLWPVLSFKVAATPESFKQIKDATRLGEIKLYARTILDDTRSVQASMESLCLMDQTIRDVNAEIVRIRKGNSENRLER